MAKHTFGKLSPDDPYATEKFLVLIVFKFSALYWYMYMYKLIGTVS
jgi:hypothetical protein